jgi:hypothetical protein
MKAQRGSRRLAVLCASTSALDWGGGVGQRHAPAALLPVQTHGIHCIGGWVGPRVGLNGCGKSRPHRDSNPGPPRSQRVAIRTELSRPTSINLIFFCNRLQHLSWLYRVICFAVHNKNVWYERCYATIQEGVK